jgi:hypothetical protein
MPEPTGRTTYSAVQRPIVVAGVEIGGRLPRAIAYVMNDREHKRRFAALTGKLVIKGVTPLTVDAYVVHEDCQSLWDGEPVKGKVAAYDVCGTPEAMALLLSMPLVLCWHYACDIGVPDAYADEAETVQRDARAQRAQEVIGMLAKESPNHNRRDKPWLSPDKRVS